MKPPTRQVPSDDCVVEIDGKEYRLHEGEWVRVLSAFAVGSLTVMRRVNELSSQMNSLKDDEATKKVILMGDTVDELIDVLKGRIVEWNWTDDLGTPLPQPLNNPDAFKPLRLEELLYLALVVRGESPKPVRRKSSVGTRKSCRTAIS